MNFFYLTLIFLLGQTLCCAEEQYQDIFINGEVVSHGSRECALRYEAIRPLLNAYKRPFTVLDIGASQGYFSFRLTTEFPHATAVMIEGNYNDSWHIADSLLKLCIKNTKLNNIIFLQKRITIEDLRKLAQTEHFDVVMAFNIIHHFGKKWKEAADAIFGLGDHILVETPPSHDKVFAQNKHIKELETYINNKHGTVLVQTPRHTDPTALASLIHCPGTKRTINRKHWFFGTLADGENIKYEIVSDFNQKIFIKTKLDTIIQRPWHRGINFITFKALNGVWPNTTTVLNNILTHKHLQHSDLLPWNFIIEGEKLTPIDNDDEFYSDPSKSLLYTIQFSLLTKKEDLLNFFLNEPHPSTWKNSLNSTGSKQKDGSIITAEISFGELIDKITILEIKKQYAQDPIKLKNIEYELTVLQKTLAPFVNSSAELAPLTQALKEVNKKLWIIEDEIRIKEKKMEFDDEFIELARSVYYTNDTRAELKRALNELLGSQIIEEKIYVDYK